MIEKKINFEQLTGREVKDLITWDSAHGIQVHKDMESSLSALVQAASSDGIQIALASGFRSYDRQLAIWNAKASGKRKLLDRNEKPIDFTRAASEEVLESILTWSALPGASRHHWGSEIDIFDRSVKAKEEVQLTQKECRDDFADLYCWLDHNLHSFPFHRPYAKDLGGVAMEPWHLSYTPLSEAFEKQYTFEVFKRNVLESELLLKDCVLDRLERVYNDYVVNVAPSA